MNPLVTFRQTTPWFLSDDTDAYVMAGSTPDPSGVVNAFVNLMYGSVASNLECTIGAPELYQINSDQSVVVHYKDEENKTMPTYARLIDTLDLVGGSNYVMVNESQNVKHQRKQQEYDKNYIADGIKDGSILKASVWMTLHQGNVATTSLQAIMVPLLGSSMNVDVILKDNYLSWRSNTEYCQKNLDVVNKRIKKESKQDVAKLVALNMN